MFGSYISMARVIIRLPSVPFSSCPSTIKAGDISVCSPNSSTLDVVRVTSFSPMFARYLRSTLAILFRFLLCSSVGIACGASATADRVSFARNCTGLLVSGLIAACALLSPFSCRLTRPPMSLTNLSCCSRSNCSCWV